MDRMQIIRAVEDESVNFVRPTPTGAFEARYVRRTNDYMIAYLSSHAGCDRACRFCHLTATGQTSMAEASVDDYLLQIEDVLGHHDIQEVRPERMNVNFMARGEPLLNGVLRDRGRWSEFREAVIERARRSGIGQVRFNVSTIMPTDDGREGDPLGEVLTDPDVAIFYSLYSMRADFRRRWLPKSIDPIEALSHLVRWQRNTGNEVALHWAFIHGENDDPEVAREIAKAVRGTGIRAKFNAVRFNPPKGSRHREASMEAIETSFSILSDAFGSPHSRIVPRVGLSVKASCGMFVETRA